MSSDLKQDVLNAVVEGDLIRKAKKTRPVSNRHENPVKFVISLTLSEKDVERIMDNITDRETEKDIYNRVRNAICRQMVAESLRRVNGV